MEDKKNDQGKQPSTKAKATDPVLSTKPKSNFLVYIGVFVLVLITAFVAYTVLPRSNNDDGDDTDNNAEDLDDNYNPEVVISNFATYKETPIDVDPKIPAYTVDQNLSNIANAEDFTFSQSVKNLLVQNAFVVRESFENEFFPLYESNRYDYIPNFVTTDSMLHNYHLMFDFLLKQLEEQKLVSELEQLNTNMLTETLDQYDTLKGTEWENAAKRNVGFFTVASILLDPSVDIPSIVADEVDQELNYIEAHAKIEESPVMNIGMEEGATIETPQGPLSLEALKEDYTQYIPRGHYDKSNELKAYFKSMMWYGRITFRMKNPDEVRSALLITLALNDGENQESWDKIYEPINFFVGKSDDITYYQFKDLVEHVYGESVTVEDIANDEESLNAFIDETESLEPPQINSMPIFEASLQEDREEEIKGFRFMGQRFTIDASIFQRLVYREVGDKTTSCEDFDPTVTSCLSGARCLPKGLDVPATMGSEEALSILDDMGETEYACYSENMSKMKEHVTGLSTEIWTQNLYWGWLYQLQPLLTEKDDGYPSFMQNDAWTRKELNTFLGNWTELKHDTILYAKQVYAEMGAGMPDEKDDRGYVEPNPQVYGRLASLLKMTSEGLNSRDLLTDSMEENLSKLEELALSLKTISEKELNNEDLSDNDYELIRTYGGQLEHFWLEVNKDEPEFENSTSQRDYLSENPSAIVADVATDPNGLVLEEGTGRIYEIYVVFPIDGELRIARGGVYSYYEFAWPMSDRLTDKKWRDLLNSGEAPDLPSWTDAFIAE